MENFPVIFEITLLKPSISLKKLSFIGISFSNSYKKKSNRNFLKNNKKFKLFLKCFKQKMMEKD